MRNAALVLGIIAGVIGIFVGLFGYGVVTLTESNAELANVVGGGFENPELTKAASFLGPLLAIAGGAMAKSRALWGGIALLISAALFFYGFGFNVATMFPIGFALLGGILAIAAGKPDEDKAHF